MRYPEACWLAVTLFALAAREARAQTAPAPAPAPGPVIDVPKEEAPALGLPRETQIENPLGRAPGIAGSGFGGYGELTFNKI